ncbi:hypothetical protein Q7P37_001156 [Cladosporium fusiforme]
MRGHQGPGKKEVETNFPRRLHLRLLAFYSVAPVVDDSQARLGRRVLLLASRVELFLLDMGLALPSDVVGAFSLRISAVMVALVAYRWRFLSRSHVIDTVAAHVRAATLTLVEKRLRDRQGRQQREQEQSPTAVRKWQSAKTC